MKVNKRIIYIVATVMWMAVIFYLSSIPDLKSPLSTTIDMALRKIAHMTEYGILYLLLYKSFQGIQQRTIVAIIIAILYAVSDEWHQSYVLGRTGAYIDVIIDSIGIIIFLIVQKNILTVRRDVP